MMSSPRILLVRMSAHGDILHALPMARLLKARLPDAHVTWLVETRYRTLLENEESIDELLEVDTFRWREEVGSPAVWLDLLRAVRTLRARRFDYAIDAQGLLKSSILARLSGAPVRIGFAAQDAKEKQSARLNNRLISCRSGGHIIDRNLELLGALDLQTDTPDFSYGLTADHRLRGEELKRQSGLTGRFVVFHPGAGWPNKMWPADKMVELGQRIRQERGLNILVTWGPGERTLAEALVQEVGEGAYLAPATDLLELAALMENGELFLGGDTGPMHLAVSLGLRVLSIFGPTDPVRNGPYGPRCATIFHGLHCAPCWLRQCPTDVECMTEIGVDEVYEQMSHLLDTPPGVDFR